MVQRKLSFLTVSCFLLFMGVGFQSAWGADEEALGQAAEQAGKHREALTHYVAALQAMVKKSFNDPNLREKIIRVAQKLDPAPAVPEEAKRFMARGRAAVKAAGDEQGFLKAAGEFKQALGLAPWLAEGYYNLGVVQDKAGRYADAIQNLKLYLVAEPNAEDAAHVQDLIYEIEYRMEEAPKQAQQVQQAEQEKTKALVSSLAGRWVEDGQYQTNYYDLTASGDGHFKLEFSYCSAKDPLMEGCFVTTKAYEGTIVGSGITGTSYFKLDSSNSPCNYQSNESMTGTVSDDGRTLLITVNGGRYDLFSCRPTGGTSSSNHTFTKY